MTGRIDWRKRIYLELDREAADADLRLKELRKAAGIPEPEETSEPKWPWTTEVTPSGVVYQRRPGRVRVEIDGHAVEVSSYLVQDEARLAEGVAYRLAVRRWAFDRAAVHVTDAADLKALDDLLAYWNTKRRQWRDAQKKMREVVSLLACCAAAKRRVQLELSRDAVKAAWGAVRCPTALVERTKTEATPSAAAAVPKPIGAAEHASA